MVIGLFIQLLCFALLAFVHRSKIMESKVSSDHRLVGQIQWKIANVSTSMRAVFILNEYFGHRLLKNRKSPKCVTRFVNLYRIEWYKTFRIATKHGFDAVGPWQVCRTILSLVIRMIISLLIMLMMMTATYKTSHISDGIYFIFLLFAWRARCKEYNFDFVSDIKNSQTQNLQMKNWLSK